MRNWTFILTGIVLIALFFSLPLTGLFIYSDQERAIVIRVIDGDTVELENEERVRLLGIDTPERGQMLFDEATDFLKEMISLARYLFYILCFQTFSKYTLREKQQLLL